MRTTMILAGLALLAGCGDAEQGAGGVSADEARQLDEAAAKLDAAGNAAEPADGPR